jgi:3-hydroxybutyryl-CoA dehydratase
MEISKLIIGDTYRFFKKITRSDVELYGKITGDFNPIHFDEEYAKTTRFKKTIVHGMYLLGLVSKAIGNDMPGVGTIYAGQEIKFIQPVFIDDTITIIISITEIDYAKCKIILSTKCVNQNDAIVMDGVAKVYNYEIANNTK